MLAKRIIPCLDVFNNQVVKGVQFSKHKVIGDILCLVNKYMQEGADELVLYDITASIEKRTVDLKWIAKISEIIDIPFCVAGGIFSVEQAKKIFSYGADKVSINSPALVDPFLISRLADCFGVQCVVVGIDTWYDKQTNLYLVKQYTGNIDYTITTSWNVVDWVKRVQELGAGEIVLNVINNDGLRSGYDIYQLNLVRNVCHVPLIASGGAGDMSHFLSVFLDANVDGALAASIFHKNIVNINELKHFLAKNGISIRLC